MTAPAAPTTGPTPADMPGAKSGTPDGSDPIEGDEDLGEDGELDPEKIAADRDKWKQQAKRNEARAKSNAQKAKELDEHGADWKAAWEREQEAKNKTKTPEQLKAEADAEADRKVAEETRLRKEAEANLLRYQLAKDIPEWAMGLIRGTTEDEITEEVETLKGDLATYVTSQIGTDDNPRRPIPNPIVGGGGDRGGPDPRAEFGSVFTKLLNR